MKLKLDENLPHGLADELTRRGHDVDTVLDEQLGGRKDPVIVQAATDDSRLLLTLDRGIGDIRSYPPGSHASVVVLRPARTPPPSSSSSIACSTRTTSTTSSGVSRSWNQHAHASVDPTIRNSDDRYGRVERGSPT